MRFVDPSGHAAQGSAASNIQSAYDAWQAGFISEKEYVANVQANGGTIAQVSTPSGMQYGYIDNGVTTMASDGSRPEDGWIVHHPNGIDYVMNEALGRGIAETPIPTPLSYEVEFVDGSKGVVTPSPLMNTSRSSNSIGESKFGDSNSENVKRMQSLLWDLEYFDHDTNYNDISIGTFDKLTLSALIRFQLANGMEWSQLFDSSGYYFGCGPNTSRMLSAIFNDLSIPSFTIHSQMLEKYKYKGFSEHNSASIYESIYALHPLVHVEISGNRIKNIANSTRGSNEQFIWDYMNKVWNLKPAQIAGIMGNIGWEGEFGHLNAENTWYPGWNNRGTYIFNTEDGIGFGLCQWTHFERKRALQSYADNRGLSVWNLVLQLEFMKYEMTSTVNYTYNGRPYSYSNYSNVWNMIRGVYTFNSISDRVAVTWIVYDKFESPGREDTSFNDRINIAFDAYGRLYHQADFR